MVHFSGWHFTGVQLECKIWRQKDSHQVVIYPQFDQVQPDRVDQTQHSPPSNSPCTTKDSCHRRALVQVKRELASALPLALPFADHSSVRGRRFAGRHRSKSRHFSLSTKSVLISEKTGLKSVCFRALKATAVGSLLRVRVKKRFVASAGTGRLLLEQEKFAFFLPKGSAERKERCLLRRT